MLTRADVERITENVLSELRIEVTSGTDQDTRIISLIYKDRTINTEYFSVVQSEYNE